MEVPTVKDIPLLRNLTVTVPPKGYDPICVVYIYRLTSWKSHIIAVHMFTVNQPVFL